jgi:8-oxo-dGTP pyrophosphatase MutT (NUDIX family)
MTKERQNYKVFFNAHCIEIGTFTYNSIAFKTNTEAIKFVRKAFKENKADYTIGVNNPSLLLNEMQQAFRFIEAAGGLVKNEKNELLGIYRNGCWDLPKGKVEKAEKIEEAAIREVEEECGISNLVLGVKLAETFHLYKIKTELILKKTHWFSMTAFEQDSLVPQTEEGIEKVHWMNRDFLDTEFKIKTYRQLNELITIAKV